METKLADAQVSVDEFVDGVISTPVGKIRYGGSEDGPRRLRDIYARHHHRPEKRQWSAQEIRTVSDMLLQLGFDLVRPLELNPMLPEGIDADDANVLIWHDAGNQLGLDMDKMYSELDRMEMDRFKWSRRAPKTDGLQEKRARRNCCVTDLEEPVVNPDEGDVSTERVMHKHPKNPLIKFTNYAFRGELARARRLIPAVLGPYGYKMRHQFAEINDYYDSTCGIGRHGDVERGKGGAAGTVNCVKVGRPIPLLFSWYHRCRPVGLEHSLGEDFPLVHVKDKGTTTVAAVATLGHGDLYLMSAKAIGKDWRQPSGLTLRHCAGARKYTGLPQTFYDRLKAGGGTRFQHAYSITFSDCVENDSETPELQFNTRFA